MIVLDTHALLWWVSDPALLSRRARAAVDGAAERRAVHVSCISAWEIALLVSRGRLSLSIDPQEWVERCESLPFFNFVPVDNRIAIKSVTLPAALHNDPADRIIIATALSLNAVLITKDTKIRRFRGIKTVW